MMHEVIIYINDPRQLPVFYLVNRELTRAKYSAHLHMKHVLTLNSNTNCFRLKHTIKMNNLAFKYNYYIDFRNNTFS